MREYFRKAILPLAERIKPKDTELTDSLCNHDPADPYPPRNWAKRQAFSAT
jgi:hypothetical protein